MSRSNEPQQCAPAIPSNEHDPQNLNSYTADMASSDTASTASLCNDMAWI